MRKKIITISSVVLILALGFIFVNQNYLSSSKYTKTVCTNSAGCIKNNDVKAGGEFSTYEFITDKAVTDEQKSAMQSQLMDQPGVKDVKFGPSCTVSNMSYVIIYYSSDETTTDNLASFVKDKQMDCSKMGNCPPGSCPHKNKSRDSKTSNI